MTNHTEPPHHGDPAGPRGASPAALQDEAMSPTPSGTRTLDFSNPAYSRVLEGGAALDEADTVIVGFHGAAGREDKIFKAMQEAAGSSVTYLAPDAAMEGWWEGRPETPVASNDPDLVASLDAITALVDELASRGIPPENIVLAGFSQGSSLINEYIAREGTSFKGIVSISGGLAGSQAARTTADLAARYPADLGGQHITLSARRDDPKVPVSDVIEAAELFRARGADVDLHIEEGEFHKITTADVRKLASAVDGPSADSAKAETALANGNVAVAKVVRSEDATDSEIVVGTFAADGSPASRPTALGETPGVRAEAPAIETLANGRFVVVFGDALTGTLKAQIFDEAGEAAGRPLTVAKGARTEEPALIGTRADEFFVLYAAADGRKAVTTLNNDGSPSQDGQRVEAGTRGADSLAGGRADDILDGRAGRDTIKGGSGDDLIFGADGSDELRGQDGDDTLLAGPGEEGVPQGLVGGAGADAFVLDGSASDVVIADFQSGSDRLVIDGSAVAGTPEAVASQSRDGSTRVAFDDTVVLTRSRIGEDDIVVVPDGDFLV